MDELQTNIELGQCYNLAHNEAMIDGQYLELSPEEQMAWLTMKTYQLFNNLRALKIAKINDIRQQQEKNETTKNKKKYF